MRVVRFLKKNKNKKHKFILVCFVCIHSAIDTESDQGRLHQTTTSSSPLCVRLCRPEKETTKSNSRSTWYVTVLLKQSLQEQKQSSLVVCRTVSFQFLYCGVSVDLCVTLNFSLLVGTQFSLLSCVAMTCCPFQSVLSVGLAVQR